MTEFQQFEQRMKELEEKMAALTKLLEKIEHKQSIHYHIKHLEIKEAAIEQLDYHLDSIAIEQLSGTLNIGNNFGEGKASNLMEDSPQKTNNPSVPVEVKPFNQKTKMTKHQPKKAVTSKQSPFKSDLTITPRNTGFTVKLNHKEE